MPLDMKMKNVIIFGLIAIIALQTLYFVHSNGANVLVHDDLGFAPLAQAVKHGTSVWDIKEFSEFRDQRPVFPNLILIVNIVLASWNVMYQLYFGWFLITLSLVPMYLILKNTDRRLKWIIILVAAFLFNTAQYVSFLMDIASRQMVLTSTAIIFGIYFINRVQSQRIALLPAILCAIIASFSGIAGLSLWIVGVLSLIDFNKIKKIPLLIWVSSAIVSLYVYFATYAFGAENKPISVIGFFTLGSLKLVLLYLSNGLIPAIERLVPIQIAAGFVILLLVTVGPIYLKKRQKEIRAIVPWIQFGLIGLFYAVMTALARADEQAPLSHYITIDLFAQISAIVIATMIFLQIYNNSTDNHKKTIVSVIFAVFIITVITTLSASYVVGWYDGSVYHKEDMAYLECMTNPIFDFKCTVIDSERDVLYNGGTIIKELHLGPFASQAESLTYLNDPLLQESNWKNINGSLNGLGAVEYIDSIPTNSNKQIQVNKTQTFVDITGWGVISKDNSAIDPVSKIRERLGITEKNPMIDGAYIFIDNKVHTKIHYGQLRLDITKTYSQVTTKNSGWNGIIDLRELSNGCHDVSVRLVVGNQYYEIAGNPQICIN